MQGQGVSRSLLQLSPYLPVHSTEATAIVLTVQSGYESLRKLSLEWKHEGHTDILIRSKPILSHFNIISLSIRICHT